MSSNSIAKNTIYIYLRMFVVLMITLYTSRVLLKTLGFDDYGLYQLVAGIVILFNFLRQALTNSSFRYIAYSLGENNSSEVKKIFASAINCYTLLALIILVLLECVGVWFLNSKLNIAPEKIGTANILFQASIVTFCLGVISAPFTASILAHERMDYYALVGIIEVVLKLSAVFVIEAISNNKVVVYSLLLVGVACIVFIISSLYCYLRFPEERYSWYWDKMRIKKLLSYSSWSIVVNGAEMGSQQAINVFFNIFIGVVGNAAIGITNQVLSGVNQFVSNLCQAFNPRIIKSYAANNLDYFFKLIYTASKISYVLFMLIAIPIIFKTEYILDLWLGDFPPKTANYIRIILISLAFDSFQMPLWLAVHATGRLSIHQSVIGGIRLISIVVIYYAFKYTGSGEVALSVSAATTALCALFRTGYLYFLVKLDLKEYLNKVALRIVLLTIVVITITYLTNILFSNQLFSFLLTLVVSSIVIVACTILFVLTNEERKYLKEVPLVGKLIK